MDSGPPKIYDIQLVINSIDFGGAPAKVIRFYGSFEVLNI